MRIFAVIAALIFATGCSSSSSNTSPNDAAASLQAFDVLNGHTTGTLHDYQVVMKNVTAKCSNPTGELVQVVKNSYADLVKNGVTTETAGSLITHLDVSIPASSKVDCQGVLAAYLVLREQGS